MKLLFLTFLFILFNNDEVLAGWRRRRRRRPPPPCGAVNCVVNNWVSWSACTHQCGNAGTQSRTRTKSRVESCRGTCPYHLTESRVCNRNHCQNGGTPLTGRCSCTSAWTGTCCETDVNECLSRPCQHDCTNVRGSYTCRCQSCFTKLGTRCELRQCKIAGTCYMYGRINPSNQCQNCDHHNKQGWTNNNALSCSDGNLCTRNDRCVNGVCQGTRFTCRSCETCDGSGCRIKPGYCVLDHGKCYTNGKIRPGKPCQQCNSNNPTRWTANNNLKCSDNNVKTKNDRCVNGECVGQPYTCLACEEHRNDACPLKPGYCVIKYNNVPTCYSTNGLKPGNPCQWCNPHDSATTWTNRNGVSCNDDQQCTRSDTCQNGQCNGISFSCNNLCQDCNGNDCSLNTGYGYFEGKCTCKIAGKDYNHQQLNSANQCQWCDLYDKSSKTNSVWANRPAVPCNDGNTCTKKDLCHSGRCIGSAYTCQSSYPQSSCIQTSQCVGDGTCKDIMKNTGTICRAALDQCDQSERCNGVLGACPPSIINAITQNNGQANITLPSFASSISFQSSTSNLYLKLNSFSASCGAIKIKWSLLKSTDSCSLGQNAAELAPNRANHALTSLTLLNTQAYKIAVQITNIRGQSALPVCTNAVTIDTSKPTSGWVRDGYVMGTDLQYQSTKAISASWGGFQTPHGVARYEVAVTYRPKSTGNEKILQGFSNFKLKVTFTKTFASITDGSQVLTKVRAYTKAGLYSEVSSNGIIVDTSPPTPGSVFDGQKINSDLRYANWTKTYQASWTQFNDPDTTITNYKFGVKQKNGGLLSSGLTAIGLRYTALISRLNLVSGYEYCAVIQGINAAGLSTQTSSDCVLIDHNAPRPGTVNDGNSSDIDYQSTNNAFTANWNGFDDGGQGSGIYEYQYKIEDKSGKQVTSWISRGLQTQVTAQGLNLLNGNAYYIKVRAIDNVGHYTEVKSDGVYVDTTHPVYTGKIDIEGDMVMKNDTPIVYIKSRTSLTASWPQFIDQHSGMKKYQFVITERNVQPTQSSWKDVPGLNLATRATFQSLSLINNKEYHLIIRGINNAGLYADIKPITFSPLSSAPQLGSVSDGLDPTINLDYQTNTTEVHATWTGFDSLATKVKSYYFAVGSCMQGNYHVTNNDFVPVQPPTSTSFSIKGLSLVNGQRYCVKIKAENLAGIQTIPVSSDGFLVDVTSPDVRHGAVHDGSGDDDIDYQTSTVQVSATWSNIQDHESGINHFEFAVSRNRAGQPDVTSFVNVGQNMTAMVSGLTLAKDVYYVMVCAVNNAQLKTCLSSDGVLIDPTSPTSGVVHDGILEPDLQYQSSTTEMSANWERIWDLESRIERFAWGIGSSEGDKTNVQDFLDVGLQTHVHSQNTLMLKHGHNYTVFLRVFNQAGGVGELTSDGITVDTTAPMPSDILPGVTNADWSFVQETGTYYSSSDTGIFVNWENFEEHESTLWYYKWSIGTSKCGTQIQPLINIGLSTSANTTRSDVTFRAGIPYYVMVISRNRAQLVSRACSPPMIFDYTPPSPGNTKVTSSGGETTFLSSDKELYVRWEGFEDFQSGIAKYEVSIENVLNYTSSSTDTSVRIPPRELLPGKSYHVQLKCINNAGLSTIIKSEEFILDNTPPVYTGDTTKLPKRRFQSDAHSLKVSWEHFTDTESPVLYYQVGIGTQASSDDLQSFKRNGLSRVFESRELNLQHNHMYYVTVQAINAANLVTSLLTEVIMFDQTPPKGHNDSVKDGQLGDDVDFISLKDQVSVHWGNIEDLESGIEKVEYCVGSTPYNCRIKSFTNIHKNSSFVCSDCKIQTGMNLFARLRVTNTAGLTAFFNSDGVIVDSSPPEIGRVFDGERADMPDVEKVDASWTPVVTWYGARDLESGIRSCEWQIVKHDGNTEVTIYVKQLDKINITYNVRWTLHADTQLKNNVSYFNVLQCWNEARSSKKQYSNGWSAVVEWPVTSYVHDGTGTRDLEYDIIGETIKASWGPFRGDMKDPVTGYEWAVGTYGGLDDIMEFTEVGLVTSVSQTLSDTDVTLERGVRYYVTVRATSLSGRTSNKSSDGFIVDTTPPSRGTVQVQHEVLNQERKEINLTISWHGFSDTETRIKKYEYCLGYIKDVCFTAKINTGMATQHSLTNFVPVDKETHYAIVIATNNAGLKTIVSSDVFKIDITPPVMGGVRDGIEKDWEYINSSFALATTWFEFFDPETGIKQCTLTVKEESLVAQVSMPIIMKMNVNASGSVTHNDLILTPGLRYLSTVECENPDGFKTTSSSNGVIVDDSPPIAGLVFSNSRPGSSQANDVGYQASTDTLYTHWEAASDSESGLREYLVGVSSGAYEDDVHQFVPVGLATEAKIGNLTLASGSIYHVILEIVNKAGMRSRAFSDGVIVDTTWPVITEVKLQNTSASSIFIGPNDHLTGSWNAFDDESDIDFTEYCVGTTSGECQVQEMRRVPGNETRITCFDCKLKHREAHFMTMRVWNKAGLFTLATTQGVKTDFTPPSSGHVIADHVFLPCVNRCALAATFSGFKDDESGIKSCEFFVQSTNGSRVSPVRHTTSGNRAVMNNTHLQHSEMYQIIVSCINNIGEKSIGAYSSPVKIDNTPPEIGHVIISPGRNHDIRNEHSGCHFLNQTLRVYWTGFHDKESGISGFRVGIGRQAFKDDVMSYQNLEISSEAKFNLDEKYGLSRGDTIFASVEVTNHAGLTKHVTSLPTRLISETDRDLVSEHEFQCINI